MGLINAIVGFFAWAANKDLVPTDKLGDWLISVGQNIKNDPGKYDLNGDGKLSVREMFILLREMVNGLIHKFNQ